MSASHIELASGLPFSDEETKAQWRSHSPKIRAGCLQLGCVLIFNFIKCLFYFVTVSRYPLGAQLGLQGVCPKPGPQKALSPGWREIGREHRGRGQGEKVLGTFEEQRPEPSC